MIFFGRKDARNKTYNHANRKDHVSKPGKLKLESAGMRKIVLVFLLTWGLFLHGERLGVLNEVLKPEGMEIIDGKLYIVEGATFLVYSLPDLKYIARFCRQGEGPGETVKIPIVPNNVKGGRNFLMVEGMNKLIFFSPNFKIIKEVKKRELLSRITPLGMNYVGIRMSLANERLSFTLQLIDPDFKILKELYKQEIPYKQNTTNLLIDTIHYMIYKDKIYVEESQRGFVIEIFDYKGNRVSQIKENFEAKKITDVEKKELFDRFKDDPYVISTSKKIGGIEQLEKVGGFIFPDYFPTIQDIVVVDDKIYVSTYERNAENKEKYYVTDLSGKTIKTVYLPVVMKSPVLARMTGRENRFYAIWGEKFYYLVENEENDSCDLHFLLIK